MKPPRSSVLRFPFELTVDCVPNDPRLEWLLSALDGVEPARQKRLILQARMPEVGFLDLQQATLLIDALGLGGF